MKIATKERCLGVIGADCDMIFPNDDNILRFDYRIDYGVLLVRAGVFPGVKSAWKAGFNGQVPHGWTDVTINDIKVMIYNPSEVQWYNPPVVESTTPPWKQNDDDEDNWSDEYGDPCSYDLNNPAYGGWQRGS